MSTLRDLSDRPWFWPLVAVIVLMIVFVIPFHMGLFSGPAPITPGGYFHKEEVKHDLYGND